MTRTTWELSRMCWNGYSQTNEPDFLEVKHYDSVPPAELDRMVRKLLSQRVAVCAECIEAVKTDASGRESCGCGPLTPERKARIDKRMAIIRVEMGM